jgi:hypothetical protein
MSDGSKCSVFQGTMEEIRKIKLLNQEVSILMRPPKQVQSITSSASLVIYWKRLLRSLGCKWEANVTEIGCVCVHGNAQPQDQSVVSFVHVVKNLTFQYMTKNQ